jgi:hypothetical protein
MGDIIYAAKLSPLACPSYKHSHQRNAPVASSVAMRHADKSLKIHYAVWISLG